MNTVKKETEQQGAGGAALAHPHSDREGGGSGLSSNVEGRLGVAVHRHNTLPQVRGHVQFVGEDLPKHGTRDAVVGLLQVDEGDGEWATAIGRGEQEVGDKELVVIQAVMAAEPCLCGAAPGPGLGERLEAVEESEGEELTDWVWNEEGAVHGWVCLGAFLFPDRSQHQGLPGGGQATSG